MGRHLGRGVLTKTWKGNTMLEGFIIAVVVVLILYKPMGDR